MSRHCEQTSVLQGPWSVLLTMWFQRKNDPWAIEEVYFDAVQCIFASLLAYFTHLEISSSVLLLVLVASPFLLRNRLLNLLKANPSSTYPPIQSMGTNTETLVYNIIYIICLFQTKVCMYHQIELIVYAMIS